MSRKNMGIREEHMDLFGSWNGSVYTPDAPYNGTGFAACDLNSKNPCTANPYVVRVQGSGDTKLTAGGTVTLTLTHSDKVDGTYSSLATYAMSADALNDGTFEAYLPKNCKRFVKAALSVTSVTAGRVFGNIQPLIG